MARPIVDLTGQTFNRLTVLEQLPKLPGKPLKWRCQCTCGNIVEVQGGHLKDNTTLSCGCYRKETWFTDLTGMVFGRLAILERAPNDEAGRAMWHCRCSCDGKIVTIRGDSLHGGRTTSCGCVNRENTIQRQTIHGYGGTREYHTWRNMLDRCYNPNNTNYPNYGGRGITVCDRWCHSFEAFFEDMGPKPHGLTIDRIDNDSGYRKDNCRWATPKEQNNNRRNNHWVEYQGETMTIAQLVTRTGIPRNILNNRLNFGMSPEEAIAMPFDVCNTTYIDYEGVPVTIHELSVRFNIPYDYLYEQIALGYSPEDIVELCLSYRN